MKARAAATLSAAGAMLVAGCSGGGVAGPRAPVGASPQSQKVSFALIIPRSAPQSVQSSKKRSAQSRSSATLAVRNPKYISPGIFNGYLVIKVYQNGQPATADQKFTIGFGRTSDFSCYFIPPTYLTEMCYNNVDVYAPIGNDTFFAETFDSSNHLLSISPGLYGTYGSAPQAYTIPYSGTISIPTSGYVSAFSVQTPTSCVNQFATLFFPVDADGFTIFGPLANPMTVTTTGGFSLSYLGSPIGSSYTFYDASTVFYDLSAATVGGSGSVSATTAAGTLPSNITNLYAVDHTAFVVSSSGLYAMGLFSGGASAFNCGKVALYNLNGFPPTASTFTNPVAMTSDSIGSLAIVDEAGTHPTLDFIPGNDLLVSPAVGGIVEPVALSSTGGIDVASSISTYKSYVLNTDGTVQVVDTTYSFQIPFSGPAFFGTAASGLTTPAGSSLAVLYTSSQDSIFVSSYSTQTVSEIDSANTGSPIATNVLLSTTPLSLQPGSISSAVATDPNTAVAFFRVFDPSFHDVVVTCGAAALPCLNNTLSLGMISPTFAGAHTLAPLGAYSTMLATQGANVLSIPDSTLISTTFFSGLSPAPTQVVTSPDAAFIGVQQGSSFSFFPYSGGASLGTLPGTAAAIINGAFIF